MPLVKPLSPDSNPDIKKMAEFFNETLGFCPNSVLTMQLRPEIASSFINLNIAVMNNKGRVTFVAPGSKVKSNIVLPKDNLFKDIN